MNIKLETNLVGVAGEYLVAGELSLRGLIASISLRNSRGIDIIASNSEGEKSVTIQVKTNSSGKPRWILTKKSEEFFSDNHYYIFVALQSPSERAKFYLVPSKVVATFIKQNHETWLKGKKRDGSLRKDSNIRSFSDENNKYLEKWEILNL